MGLHLGEDSCHRGEQFGFAREVAIVSSRAARVLPEPFGGIQLGRIQRQLGGLPASDGWTGTRPIPPHPCGREALSRKSVKILGAIELWRTRFHYRQDTVFNALSYLAFLEQLARRYRRQGRF